MTITELAPAKLNLTLDVGTRRPDGYHEITSVMQSAALYDVVTLETVETEGGGRLFSGDKYPPYRDFYPIGEENPLPGRSWRRQQ